MTINTHFKSAFWEPQKLKVQIALILLSFSSSLFFYNISWAQSVTQTTVSTQSQRLKNRSVLSTPKDLSAINDALKQYNSQDATPEDKRKAIDIFQQNLKSSNKKARNAAVNALSAIGTGADQALGELKSLLNTEQDNDVLSSVIAAIQSINANEAISELISIFKDEQKDLQVRSLAARALETTSAKTEQVKEFIPLLLESLKDQSADKINLRISAASALSKMYHHLHKYPEAVPILTNSLTDPAWRVRRYTADALGNIGVDAKSAIPKIIAAYRKERNYTMCQSAVYALGNIAEGSVEEALTILPVLNEALNNPSSIVRSSAAEALRDIAATFEGAAKSNELKTKNLNKAIYEFEKALTNLEKLEPEEKDSYPLNKSG